MRSAKYWIDKLDLSLHPEGGYYKNTYVAGLVVPRAGLPDHFTGDRAISSAIYFLLKGDQFSAFHRLRSDEIWHFYEGSPLHLYTISPSGELSRVLLGNDPEAGQQFQAIVKAGHWMAAHPVETGENAYSLFGCTVAPGFDFEDLELARVEELIRTFPRHRETIEKYCLE